MKKMSKFFEKKMLYFKIYVIYLRKFIERFVETCFKKFLEIFFKINRRDFFA